MAALVGKLSGNDRLSGTLGADTFTLYGDYNGAYGGGAGDTGPNTYVVLNGGSHNDLIGNAAIDHFDGGTGIDNIASYQYATAPLIASLANSSINTGDARGDTYVNIHELTGSPFGGSLYGDNSGLNNQLWGLGGTNYLYGGTGYTTFILGPSDDHVVGGAGGGLADYEVAAVGVTASLANPAINTNAAVGDTYSGVTDIAGSDFNDVLYGDGQNNVMLGLLGNDTLYGAAGNDTFDTGKGADVVFGGAGTDQLVITTDNLTEAKSGVYKTFADFDQGNAGIFQGSENDFIGLQLLGLTSGQVRVLEGASNTYADLQVLVGSTWTELVRLNGLHAGDTVHVLLDSAQPLGFNYSAQATAPVVTPTPPSAITPPPTGSAAFGAVTHDAHSAGGQVYALYDGLLGRAPDPLGLEFWTDAFNDGVSPTTLAAGLLASPEGSARAGALGNSAFVTQLYSATLHRAPDAAGLKFWTDDLNAGDSRAAVGLGFAMSTEHLANIQPALNAGLFVPDADAAAAARVYYTVLGRAPDAAGLQFWANAIKTGTPLTTETQSFLATPEAQAKTASLSTAQYVDLVYSNALGRHADAAGLSFWTNAIDNHTATRADVTTQIGESQEASLHLLPLIEQGWHLG